LIIRLEQADTRLAADLCFRGPNFTNREYDLVRRLDSSTEKVRFGHWSVKLLMKPALGVRITEKCRVSRSGNLTITRVVPAGFRKERQRLMLVSTTSLLE
jgi:hypothetical protein